MEYRCIENNDTGELKIIINGDTLELSMCARTILDIVEGSESLYLKSKVHSDKLSKVSSPVTVTIGNSKQEQFSYSKNGLEYYFLSDGHPKCVVDAAKNHYIIMKRELEDLVKLSNDNSGIYSKRPRDVDYYG
ncbi:MAG: hypothetical protein ACP5NW_00380 [Candidatus Woesearchaeota archaeon]